MIAGAFRLVIGASRVSEVAASLVVACMGGCSCRRTDALVHKLIRSVGLFSSVATFLVSLLLWISRTCKLSTEASAALWKSAWTLTMKDTQGVQVVHPSCNIQQAPVDGHLHEEVP